LSGYTPLFSSLTTGTLCGKWPDIGLWPIVLSMADRHGVVDVTPAYLSNVTGLPIAEVVGCMERFCAEDPYSRTSDHNGARLVLIDEHRAWGWRVVNHSKYREKARLQSKDAARTASGADAARKQAERAATTNVPPRPPASPALPLSDSYADSDKSKRPRKSARGTRIPEDFTPDLDEARKAIPDLDAEAEAAKFRDYWTAKTGAGATKADWPATWRNWIRNCADSGRYAKRKTAHGNTPETHRAMR
jgi:hypothetical protein